DRPRENLGELENRGRHLGKAVELSNGARGLDHSAVAPCRLGEKILGTTSRLQRAHYHSLPALPKTPPGVNHLPQSAACREALQALASCALAQGWLRNYPAGTPDRPPAPAIMNCIDYFAFRHLQRICSKISPLG